MEHLLDKTTQHWVKLTGRRIDPHKHSWLIGPSGDTDIIGDQFIYRLAEAHKLTIDNTQKQAGLLNSIDQLGLSTSEKELLNDQVKDFYENTSNYHFEVWSQWRGIFKPFGWLLSILFSRRLQQLNLPLNSLDASKGLNSQIIKLKNGNKTVWTIWYRILKSNNHVIYSGIYTTCHPSNYSHPLLKVIFPLPNGNATVIMTKHVGKDGSLTLSSDGKRFGENGFYFTLQNKNGKYWAKYVKVMHEWIKVYVDDENVLRANHNLNIFGFRFLDLHYKMTKK